MNLSKVKAGTVHVPEKKNNACLNKTYSRTKPINQSINQSINLFAFLPNTINFIYISMVGEVTSGNHQAYS